MLKWTAIVIVTFATIVLLTYLWGRALPEEHIAEGALDIAARPETVAAWIRDVDAQPTWRPGVKKIQVLERASDFVRYREDGSDGSITYRLREAERDRVFESLIDDASLPFGGRWIIRIDPKSAGSQVQIREEGTVRPPLFRFLSRYAFGLDASLRKYLDALAARAARDAQSARHERAESAQ
jgi:Polyketide cyclase / dehydrase and lipid transport